MRVSRVEGVDRLVNKLRARLVQAEDADATVGFTAQYAIYVHENLEPKTLGLGIPRPSGLGHLWGPSDYGPKFLERPFREMRADLVNGIADDLRGGVKLGQALLRAGLKLQAVSQKLVPVEYGTLKQSAFTRLEVR